MSRSESNGSNQVSPTYPMSNTTDHHLEGGNHQPPGPVRQHHRLAAGKTVSGTSNPYGAGANTKNMVGNGDGKTY